MSLSQNPTDRELNRNFQFLDAIDNEVYIDSRVYCFEVIQVNHSDWIQNVLRKHQDSIEARFGVLRFENGKPIKGSDGGRSTVFCLLTEDQCNACLVLSANSRKTIRAKLDLVEDFSTAKRLLRAQLDRQFAASAIAQTDIPHNLTGKTQKEIYQLASDYVQIRIVAAKAMPTLIEILDALADPAGVPAATNWFTARSWLAANGYTMAARQQRQFFQAIANTHRFLTVTPPQQHNGVNYYSNQHDILLRACATNVLRLGLKRTAKFI